MSKRLKLYALSIVIVLSLSWMTSSVLIYVFPGKYTLIIIGVVSFFIGLHSRDVAEMMLGYTLREILEEENKDDKG